VWLFIFRSIKLPSPDDFPLPPVTQIKIFTLHAEGKPPDQPITTLPKLYQTLPFFSLFRVNLPALRCRSSFMGPLLVALRLPPGWKPGSASAKMADATVFKHALRPATSHSGTPPTAYFKERLTTSRARPIPYARQPASYRQSNRRGPTLPITANILTQTELGFKGVVGEYWRGNGGVMDE